MTTHILFDFFGTLVEYSDSRTKQGYERSHSILLAYGANLDYQGFLDGWSTTFHRFDLESDIEYEEFSMDDVITGFLTDVLGSGFAPGMIKVFRDTYLDEWNKGVRYIDGVPALLDRLKDQYSLVLVTNTHNSDLVRSHLRNMNVADYFSLVVTSVEHGKRKPHPSIFELALSASGAEYQQAVYVGDNYATDYVGAKGIGMRCLLVDPHKKQNIPSEDRIFHILDIQQALKGD